MCVVTVTVVVVRVATAPSGEGCMVGCVEEKCGLWYCDVAVGVGHGVNACPECIQVAGERQKVWRRCIGKHSARVLRAVCLQVLCATTSVALKRLTILANGVAFTAKSST